MNKNDLIAYAIESPDRTKNLEQLIWAVTGLIGLVVASFSIVAIVAFHYRLGGGVGVAAAAIAGLGGLSRAIRRWVRRHRQAGRRAGGQAARPN